MRCVLIFVLLLIQCCSFCKEIIPNNMHFMCIIFYLKL